MVGDAENIENRTFKEWVDFLDKDPKSFIIEKKFYGKKINKYYGGNANKVLERDNWTCQRCGKTVFLQIHHKDGKSPFSTTRYNIKEFNNKLENLITLCAICHNKVHRRELTFLTEKFIRRNKDFFVNHANFGKGHVKGYVDHDTIKIGFGKIGIYDLKFSGLEITNSLFKEILNYFVETYSSYCWHCFMGITWYRDKRCEKCGWYICSICSACGCGYAVRNL